jgi:aromatic ring-cleaving dioxygenase
MPRRPQNLYKAYHAHVYFGPDTVAQARELVAQAGGQFKVQVGRVHEQLVGPHPAWSCQLAFSSAEFDRITHAYWLGNEWPLNLEMFRDARH